MTEIWKPVKGFEDYYHISNLGNVKKLEREFVNNIGATVRFPESISKGYFDGRKYLYYTFQVNNKRKNFKIHQLVAQTFIQYTGLNPDGTPIKGKPQVNHKDENPFNNSLDNLEWCDSKYNNNYGNHNKNLSVSKKGKKPKISEKNRLLMSKKVYQYDISGIFLNEFDSLANAARSLGKNNPTPIGNCCNGRSKTSYGFVWRFV